MRASSLFSFHERIQKEAFFPSWLGLAVNPFYISRSMLARAIADYAPEIAGVVLDFGCGSKPYEAIFTKAEDYIGVDIAVSGHDHRESSVDFFWDGEKLPFEDNTFDSIVAFEVMEHVFNPSQVLSELQRVIKPGGVMLITVPFVHGEHETPFDFARYTSFGLNSILNAAGFSPLKCLKIGSFTDVVLQMISEVYFSKLRNVRYFGFLALCVLCLPLNVLAVLLRGLLSESSPERRYFLNLVSLSRFDKK